METRFGGYVVRAIGLSLVVSLCLEFWLLTFLTGAWVAVDRNWQGCIGLCLNRTGDWVEVRWQYHGQENKMSAMVLKFGYVVLFKTSIHHLNF